MPFGTFGSDARFPTLTPSFFLANVVCATPPSKVPLLEPVVSISIHKQLENAGFLLSF